MGFICFNRLGLLASGTSLLDLQNLAVNHQHLLHLQENLPQLHLQLQVCHIKQICSKIIQYSNFKIYQFIIKVGPGASKDGPYKNPEYYTYNEMSFYDIERDMKSFRLPQPSSLKK